MSRRNRRADWRRIKSKYSYTVEEAARALNLHRNTVRNWIRRGGLAAMTGSRPHLILGMVLIEFLRGRRLAAKRKCGLGELYCLKCRAPRKPVAELIEHRPMASGRTRIVGICLTCETLMHRFVASRNLEASLRELGVQSGPAHVSLADTGYLSLNCHSAPLETGQ
jgi:excisionase family DNA binding protein